MKALDWKWRGFWFTWDPNDSWTTLNLDFDLCFSPKCPSFRLLIIVLHCFIYMGWDKEIHDGT